jgi:enoyl-CoA hydratase/carnithine racemase
MISTFIVPQLGPFLSKELFLTGRTVQPHRAVAYGFVTAVAADTAALDVLTRQYCDMLLDSAPRAMALVKALVDFETTHSRAENLVEAQRVFSVCMHSDEAKHGLAAFRRRQKPNWSVIKASL